MILQINFFLPFLILFSNANSQSTTLEHVSVFFRHGNRGPFVIYPTNPTQEKYWSRYGGLAELTNKGVKQMFDLGTYLKSYYNGVIPQEFDLNKIYIRSTGVKRALLSAQSVLAGMYKPNQFQKWTNDTGYFNWFPIPVESAPLKEDPLFNYESNFICPKYLSYKQQSLLSDNHKKIVADNQAFVNRIANLSGMTDLDYYKLWIIADDTYNELAEGLKVPQWVLDNFEGITRGKNYGYDLDFGTIEKARFFGGNLLREINQNIRNKINKSLNYTFSIYSNHDYNLVSLIRLLDFTKVPPVEIPYYSSIAIELRKGINNTYYTQVLFRNGTYGNPQPFTVVQINGCDKLCPIEKYFQLTSTREMIDYKKECEFSKSNPDQMNIFRNFYL